MANEHESEKMDGEGRAARPTLADRLAEREPEPVWIPRRKLKTLSRRDFLLFGAGTVAAAGAFWWMLPEDTQQRLFGAPVRARLDTLEARVGLSPARSAARKEKFFEKVLSFDDDVAEALTSPGRMVRTYDKSDITPDLRNNYKGATPDPAYLEDWTLTVDGLASGRTEELAIADLTKRFAHHEQVTRLVCVEGWSAVVGWGGLRFADFLAAFPPMPGAKWASLTSKVDLDYDGNSEPYYVSVDLATARHPQTLLATHHDGKPLAVEHGAPLRLVAPMKLGLKNIKAITSITYSAAEPADYWNEAGYSKYDGI
jgi:DMSO/TMAO reductase YedYZ molybdopterin-dependent catalytic subunit